MVQIHVRNTVRSRSREQGMMRRSRATPRLNDCWTMYARSMPANSIQVPLALVVFHSHDGPELIQANVNRRRVLICSEWPIQSSSLSRARIGFFVRM